MDRPLAIDCSRVSGNHGPRIGVGRPNAIVLHYTGMRDKSSAVDWLCDPASQVSCHYVVTEAGAILRLVDEDRRAWHAGRSSWQGETDLNSASVGIEIVNGGHDFGLPSFPPAQVSAVVGLCRDIIRRHAISQTRILAHSDIAPARKRDPGERFPWRSLADAGVGLWPMRPAVEDGWQRATLVETQLCLRSIGYDITPDGLADETTTTVLRAFQRRYRPDRVDGTADQETCALIAAVSDLHRRAALMIEEID